MNKILMKRLKQEAMELKKNPVENCSAGPINDTLLQWEATIFGPTDTPYFGGVYKLSIYISDEYPFKPPKIKFLTPIFHCNIYKETICLDILKDSSWMPCLDISKILLSICSLLSDPNPNDPLNQEASQIYLKDKNEYKEIAQKYTLKYANN
jgi:ubiquitin-conjugating enzyme E2 D/E